MIRQPFRERYLQISSKLNSIETKDGKSKAHRIDRIEEKTQKIEDKMQAIIIQRNKDALEIKEQLLIITKQIETETEEHNERIGKQELMLQDLEELIESNLKVEINERLLNHQQILNYLQEKIVYLNSYLYAESKVRHEQMDSFENKLQIKIPQLSQKISSASIERQTTDEHMLIRAGNEIVKINACISENCDTRLKTQQAIMEMMTDLIIKAKDQLQEEKLKRIQSQDNILGLIELVGDKMIQISSKNIK